MLGVGDAMPSVRADDPHAKHLMTMRARTPSGHSSFLDVTHLRAMTFTPSRNEASRHPE